VKRKTGRVSAFSAKSRRNFEIFSKLLAGATEHASLRLLILGI